MDQKSSHRTSYTTETGNNKQSGSANNLICFFLSNAKYGYRGVALSCNILWRTASNHPQRKYIASVSLSRTFVNCTLIKFFKQLEDYMYILLCPNRNACDSFFLVIPRESPLSSKFCTCSKRILQVKHSMGWRRTTTGKMRLNQLALELSEK